MQEVLDSSWWYFPSVTDTLQFHQNILLQSHALRSDHLDSQIYTPRNFRFPFKSKV